MKLRKYQRGFWQFAIPAIASVGASLIGGKGQRDTNEANLEIAREQMAWNTAEAEKGRNFNSAQAYIERQFNKDETQISRQFAYDEAQRAREFNANEAQTNRQFQERMANSTYQRAVGDLTAAGLNPMLAYSQGGAPAPSGSMASGPMASSPQASGRGASGPTASGSFNARQESVAVAAVNSALAGVQLSNLHKQGENIDADTALKQAAAVREEASAGNLKMQTEKLIVGDIPKVREEINVLTKMQVNSESLRLLHEAQKEVAKVEAAVKAEEIPYIAAKTALDKVRKILADLDVPMAKAMADKFGSSFGHDVSPYIREVLEVLRLLAVGRRGGH